MWNNILNLTADIIEIVFVILTWVGIVVFTLLIFYGGFHLLKWIINR